MALIQATPVRLALLDANGSKLKTLFLPIPDWDGIHLDWEERGKTWDLDDGGEVSRIVGFLPVLRLRWSHYDERPGMGYPIGTGDGQRPTLEDLLWFLSQPSGRIRISPGLNAGAFTVNRTQHRGIGKRGLFYTGLEVTFRGRHAQPTQQLEVF